MKAKLKINGQNSSKIKKNYTGRKCEFIFLLFFFLLKKKVTNLDLFTRALHANFIYLAMVISKLFANVEQIQVYVHFFFGLQT